MPRPALAQDAAAEEASEYTFLEGITITSTKTEQSWIDAMSGTSVVTPTEIEQIQADRISDMLQNVPGVETQQDGDDPATAINIRGLQDFGRVNVMIEGARQNFQRSGHSADGQFYLEPELVRAVDITRGPVSNIFGSGAIGGVVNFELIDPHDFLLPGQTYAVRAKPRYNSNDNGRLVNLGGAAAPLGGVSVLGNFTYRDNDSYHRGNGEEVPLTGEEVKTGLFKTLIEPGGGNDIELLYLYQEDDYITRDPDDVASFQRDTTTTDETAVARWNFDAPTTDLIDSTVSGYYTTTQTDQTRITIPSPCVPPPLGICSAELGSKRDFKIETLGSDAYNTSLLVTGLLNHAVTFGADIFKDEVETNDPGGSGDEFTPDGERTVYGTYIQDQIDIGTLIQIVGGVRYDAYELKPSQGEMQMITEDGTVDEPSDNTGNHFSPKITLGITPTQGIQFFGTYAQGYRAPAIIEAFNAGTHDIAFPFGFLTNPDLEAETAETYEVGVNVKYENKLLPNDVIYGKFVYFENTIDNYIEAVIFPSTVTPIIPPPPAPPIPTGVVFDDCPQAEIPLCFQYQNIDRAFIYGIEFESTYDAGFMFARAAYSRIRGQDEEINVPLLSVNPDKFAGTLGFRFLDETLAVGGRWAHVWAQNEVPGEDRTGGLIVPSETFDLVDLFAVYQYSEKYSMTVNLNNVLDQDYTKYRQFDPEPGFSAAVSGTVKLGG